jgi:hypothetical protein
MGVRWLACLLLVGCSASERIAVEANAIGERAATINSLAIRIGERSTEPDTIAAASTIAMESAYIGKATQAIHTALPGVTDRTPWWADLLRWLAIAAAGAAAVWLLTASGVLGAVRAALGWIPAPKRRAASLLAAAVDDTRPETTREAVAAMRAQDPEFDVAWRKALQSDLAKGA